MKKGYWIAAMLTLAFVGFGLTAFQKTLKAKYPEVQLVASADPFTDRPAAKEQSAALRKMNADLIDEHFYRTPDWFLAPVWRTRRTQRRSAAARAATCGRRRWQKRRS